MVASTRRLLGAVLALVAAIAVVWSAFIDWYGGRNGSDIRVQDLFNNITTEKADSLGSLFIPLGVSAILVLVGIAIQNRWLWVLGGLIAIATPLLWGLRQAQAFTGLHASLVGRGPALAAAGGALMLIAAAVTAGKSRRDASSRTSRKQQRAATDDMAVAPAPYQEADSTLVHDDQWADSGQAYQQGYGHGLEQGSEQATDAIEHGRPRER
jgi:hypothetical protein